MLDDGSDGTRVSGNAAARGETRAPPINGRNGLAGMVKGATTSWGFVALGGYRFVPISPV